MAETNLSELRFLSMKSRKGLRSAGITSLEAAAALTDEQLLALPDVGPSSVERIRAWQEGKEERPPVKRVTTDEFEERRMLFELYKLENTKTDDPEEALSEAHARLAVFLGGSDA